MSPQPHSRSDEKPNTETVTLTVEELKELIASKSSTTATPFDMEAFARANAEANRQALRPENTVAPGISVYNPLGDRDHPKPPLICKMFHNGIELEPEHLTRDEIDLLNRIKGGRYFVTKTDGTRLQVIVQDEQDEGGKLNRRHLMYKCRELTDLMGLTSMVSMCREILGETPDDPEKEALRARVRNLESKLAGASQR